MQGGRGGACSISRGDLFRLMKSSIAAGAQGVDGGFGDGGDA